MQKRRQTFAAGKTAETQARPEVFSLSKKSQNSGQKQKTARGGAGGREGGGPVGGAGGLPA